VNEDEDRLQQRRGSSDSWDWPLHTSSDFVPVINTKDKFQVELEAKQFAPEDIEVKTQENEIWIRCQQKEKGNKNQQFGLMAREIHRCYKMPEDVDMSSVRSHLRNDGMLVIVANKRR